jgi:hypothetical protein
VDPQSQSGGGGEHKNSQTLPGLEPLIIQPVAQRYTSELPRLFNNNNNNNNNNNKVVPVFLTQHHAIKACWGSRGIASRILDLGTKWR